MSGPLYGSDNLSAPTIIDGSKQLILNPKFGGSNILAPNDLAVDAGNNLISIPSTLSLLLPFIAAGYNPATLVIISASYTQNQVIAWRFRLPSMLVTYVTMNVTALSAGSHLAFAIYSLDGNTKILDSGALSGAANGLIEVQLGAAVQLNEGNYFLAFSQDTIAALTMQSFIAPAGNLLQGTVNASAPNDIFTAANVSVAGVMPATLGALTKFPVGTQWSFPATKLHS